MKKRTAKRTLLGSFLALLLSCAMFLGTTYAWFTDSAQTQVSLIQSGNLNLQLDYADAPETGADFAWKPAENAQNIFGTDALWEPGYTRIVYIQVTNTGSLALKYRCSVKTGDVVVGKNAQGNAIDLRNYIQVGVKPVTDSHTLVDRDTAVEGIQMKPLSGHVAGREEGVVYSTDVDNSGMATILESGESQVFALILQMPGTVGNEANYTGDPAPSLNLTITVDAAQASLESDSYGSSYDATAPYETQTQETQSDAPAGEDTPQESAGE